MVTKVRLRGLNITTNRDKTKWYVNVRATGECLLAGFEGTRQQLEKRMGDTDFLAAYNGRRSASVTRTYAEGTLGSLVKWWLDECPEFDRLADATKNDYRAAVEWLEPEYDMDLTNIDQASVCKIRDRCAKAKWPSFADKIVSALSSMFSRAVKRGKLPINSARSVDKLAKSDPNANREWEPWEQADVFKAAPPHILTPIMIARHAPDPRPLKWSSAMFRKTEERDGKQATEARRDCHEAAAG